MARVERVTNDDAALEANGARDAINVPDVEILTRDDGAAFFDEQARALLGISGAEYLRRYDAGEYDAIIDDPAHDAVGLLEFLIPFAR